MSDHCPIVLCMRTQNWGRKPFRFNNSWMTHDGFKEIVVEFWLNANVNGWKTYVVKEKLKNLKSVIRKWNSENFGDIDGKIKVLELAISDLDLTGEDGSLSESDVELRKVLFADLWKNMKDKESLLKQKSR